MSLLRVSLAFVVPVAAVALLFPEQATYHYIAGALTAALFLFCNSFSRRIVNYGPHRERTGRDKRTYEKIADTRVSAIIPYSCTSPKSPLILTRNLSVPTKLEVILNLGGLQLESLATSIAMTIGVRRLPRPLSLDDSCLAVPTTVAAKAALALCLETVKDREWIFRHCMRTYLFGAAVAEQLGITFDKETLFVASLLHDLAWTEPYDRDDEDFELLGARAAREFCIQWGMTNHKANVVHETIALHTSPHLIHQPELGLVSQGAGIDVAGFFCEEVAAPTKTTIVKAHPRLQFKKNCCRIMADHARRKPNTAIAACCRMGFLTAIKLAPFDE